MAGEELRMVLGANIRKLRNRRNWSQMELAEKSGISMNFLSEIERGNESVVENGIGEYMNRFSNDIAIANCCRTGGQKSG